MGEIPIMSITEKTISIFSLRDEPNNLIGNVPIYIKNVDGSLASIFKVADTYATPTECGNGIECGDGGEAGDYFISHLAPEQNPVYTNEYGQISIWADNSIEYTAEVISDAPKNTGLYARISGNWELFAVRNYKAECGNGIECGDGGEAGDYTGISTL